MMNLIYGRSKTRLRNFWIFNPIVSVLIWILIASAGTYLPTVFQFSFMQIDGTSPILILYQSNLYAWVIGVAITSLLLIVVFSLPRTDFSNYAGNFALIGTGLAAIFSGTPITLAISWTAIDLTELLIYFHSVEESLQRERIVYNLAVRLSGTFALLVSVLALSPPNAVNQFSPATTLQGIFILCAAFFRLGAIPFADPRFHQKYLRRGIGTILSMIPAASALILLTKISEPIFPENWNLTTFLLILLIGVASSIAWLIDRDAIIARPYWIIGMASLVFASSVQGLAAASTTWSLAIIFGGMVLFVLPLQNKRIRWFVALFPLLLAGLPYSPTWPGMSVFDVSLSINNFLFVIPLVILITGLSRHAMRDAIIDDPVSHTSFITQILVIGFITVTYLGLGIYLINLWGISRGIWQGLIVVFFWLALIGVSQHLRIRIPANLVSGWRQITSLGWLYNFGRLVYRTLLQMTRLFSDLIEGETGTLWSLLVLVLLISLLNSLFR